jgi:ubiquinone biosynthesis monooxygenase Coq7
MSLRDFSFVDLMLGEIGRAINVLAVPALPLREAPAAPEGDALPEAQRHESARLMRINHAGEVAAQALYRGQALTAKDPTVSAALRHAAEEESDHLAWCEQRLRELKGRTSILNPLWYAGSFAIGAVVGALARSASLGFVAETERQVESHLRGHLERLGSADPRSRAILEKMTHDEIQHGSQATTLGGEDLPISVRAAMRLTARVMTEGSYWL